MYRCPKCHIELPVDARYCKNCGFNQTNARIASMPPSVQGVQRQAPAQSQQKTQQAPTRTIQPQHKYVPQQPITQWQGSLQPNTNMPIAQQQYTNTTPNAPQHTPLSQNAPLATPRPQQADSQQRNTSFQQPMRPYVPVTPPLTMPLQGNSEKNGVRQYAPITEPFTPQGQLWSRSNQGMPEQVVRTSTPPMKQYAPANAAFQPLQWGLGALPDTPVNVESLEATSKAAQHWRQSWLDRQRAEAGPAVGVSRGQASVPEPLLAMQNSIARMRAIILPKNIAVGKMSGLSFWLPIILLVCLIGGLGTYVLSTYSDGLLSTTHVSANTNVEPTLTLKATKTTIVVAGQTIHVHGEHFGANDTIVFFLGDAQLQSVGGTSTSSNDRGVVDTSLAIPATQLAGDYVVQAQDKHTGQHAFLNIQTTAPTTTNILKLSVPSLTFASVVGQNNSQGQNVSITNTSNGVIQWSATAISDNQAGWLLLADGKTSGQLEAGQTDTIRASVLTQGLTSNPANHPYLGEIVFTLTGQGQITLPVQLTMSETSVELIINPNPIVALQSQIIPGGCQDTTLTLINLSNTPITWDIQTDGFSQQHITLDGKPNEQGQLFPSGLLNDTKVIKIGCKGVQLDQQYAVNVFYNRNQQHIPISVIRG